MPQASYALTGLEPEFFCTASEQAEISAFSANVTIDYEITMASDGPVFYITLTNLTEDMILIDKKNLKSYQNFKPTGSELTIRTTGSGDYDIDIYSKKCKSRITTKTVRLPRYNYFYDDPLCEGLSSYKQCQRWSGYNESRETFESDIQKIKSDLDKPAPEEEEVKPEVKTPWYEQLTDLFIKYWWVGIIAIVFVTFIIYMIRSKNKKDEYDFKL